MNNNQSGSASTPDFTLVDVADRLGGNLVKNGTELRRLNCPAPNHPGDRNSLSTVIKASLRSGYPIGRCWSRNCDWRDIDTGLRGDLGLPPYQGNRHAPNIVMRRYESADGQEAIEVKRFDWRPGDPACWWTDGYGSDNATPCAITNSHKHCWPEKYRLDGSTWVKHRDPVDTTDWPASVETGDLDLLADQDRAIAESIRGDGYIMIVEGEKAADAVIAAGLTALCVPFGHTGFGKCDLSAVRGRNCILWPDHDERWQDIADRIAAGVHRFEPRHLRLVEPVGQQGSKDDAADLTVAGVLDHVSRAIDRGQDITVDPTLAPGQVRHDGSANRSAQPTVFPKSAEGLVRALRHIGLEVRFNLRSHQAQYRPLTAEATILVDQVDRPWPGGWYDAGDLVDADVRDTLARLCESPTQSGKTGPCHFSAELWREKMLAICNRVGVDPVQEWLESLAPHDGTSRLDSLMQDCWQVPEYQQEDGRSSQHTAEYLQQAARILMVGMVARTLSPGCFIEAMVILVGKEGIGKSSGLLELFPDEWQDLLFIDNITFKIVVDDKKLVEKTRGVLLAEVGELAGLNKADANAVKSSLSSRIDKNVRAAYARHPKDYDRRFTFCGSSNDDGDGILPDVDGKRRYWIVRVPDDLDRDHVKNYLTSHRDQLWAEALAIYRREPTAHVPPTALKKEQGAVNDAYRRRTDDAVTLADAIEAVPGLDDDSLINLAAESGYFVDWEGNPMPTHEIADRLSRYGNRLSQALGRELVSRGWIKLNQSRRNGVPIRAYLRPENK